MSAVERLLDISSTPLGEDPISVPAGADVALVDLLSQRNGFYAFEGALHVRPATSIGAEIGLDDWNNPELWRDCYERLASDWIFFAEDVFGGQFGVRAGSVGSFDPETSDVTPLAASIEEWAHRIVEDHQILTGWPLCHDWQSKHGPLGVGRRLIPKVPFVLGGEFAPENLYDADAVLSLRYRAEIAGQIAQVPDGSTVRLRIVE